MTKWTEEQLLAINKESTNIIVSAGAGSGKTAVLSERTIRKLKSGININNLLILTFTKAAAFEMKNRIRQKIKEIPELKEQLDNIDSAYITTFDSFSLSVVKKYNYILNLNNDIKIVENTVIDIEKEKIIEEIFNEEYEKENKLFLDFIDTYSIKNDKDLKKIIIKINNKLDLKYDKISYLNNYLKDNFNPIKINYLLNEYEDLIKNKIQEINDLLELFSSDFSEKLYDSLSNLLSAKDYDSIKESIPSRLPNLPKNSDDTEKESKEKLSSIIKNIKELTIYNSRTEIIDLINSSYNTIKIIIDIILELDRRVNKFKKNINCYEFIDISKLAIKLVTDYKDVREELKNYFNEIMIDEYQDTSDLQELFISKIENNNVYMVGDIKQSIYRFRNANPYIFKTKYDNYALNKGGFKIDLTKNFRSREEVILNINEMFNLVMDDEFGGANYIKEHQMEAKNPIYLTKSKQDYNLEIINYRFDKDLKFNKNEIEIFTIAKDIKEKIDKKYQILDDGLRDCKYSDFAILIDRGTDFNIYKKIFMYLNIPLMVYQDINITNENDLILINNIFKLVKSIYYKKYDQEFKRNFTSIARSYLCSMNDNDIFKLFVDNNFYDTELYKALEDIANDYLYLNATSLLDMITDKFKFYERQLLIGNNQEMMARINYLYKLMESMTDIGYSIDEVIDNFALMFENKHDIKCKLNKEQEDAVKIMTIHNSKGLEFPICYFAEYYADFNISDVTENFIFDNKYGLIVPLYNGITYNNISKELMKNLYLHEEISEKIRLFYVALTRAKEKMIIINSINEKDKMISRDMKYKYRSFKDIILSIRDKVNVYEKNIDIDSLNMSRDYKNIIKSNYQEQIKATPKIIYQEINVDNQEIENSNFSKKINDIIDINTYNMTYEGRRFHYIFEVIDFKNPDYSLLNSFEKEKVTRFLELDIFKNVDSLSFYKEYEFIYEEDNIKKHGIIDLIIEDNDSIKIIDYKLKNISDSNYLKQLNGYKEYIKKRFNKNVNIYLYSILDNELEKLD